LYIYQLIEVWALIAASFKIQSDSMEHI